MPCHVRLGEHLQEHLDDLRTPEAAKSENDHLPCGAVGAVADEQIWLALFRLHAERGDRLGLLREERRMRDALRELVEDLGPGEGDHIAELGRETMEEYRKLLASLREKEPATA